jgi:hypothetical protein
MSKSKKKSPVKKSTETKTKSPIKKKPTQTKENKNPKSPSQKKPKEETKENKKPVPTQTKENKKSVTVPTQTKENKKPVPTQTKENKKPEEKKVEEKKPLSPRKRANSMEFFDKYGYDIYMEDEKRHEALGNLVIVFGPSELIKKLDSESMKTPNMSNKFNNDKKWIRDNFKR